jgi:cytochrome c oxidase subunit 4
MTDHVLPVKTYLGVFFALLLLLAATVLVAQLHLGEFGVFAALTIAVTKTILVVLFFMHVRYSSRLVWIFVGVGFYWLMILLILTMSDFVSRAWPPFSGGPM